MARTKQTARVARDAQGNPIPTRQGRSAGDKDLAGPLPSPTRKKPTVPARANEKALAEARRLEAQRREQQRQEDFQRLRDKLKKGETLTKAEADRWAEVSVAKKAPRPDLLPKGLKKPQSPKHRYPTAPKSKVPRGFGARVYDPTTNTTHRVWHPHMRAVWEIQRLRQFVDRPLIPRLPFIRAVRRTVERLGFREMRWQSTAISALQEGSEVYLSQFFENVQRAAVHAKRVTIMPDDFDCVMDIIGYKRTPMGSWKVKEAAPKPGPKHSPGKTKDPARVATSMVVKGKRKRVRPTGADDELEEGESEDSPPSDPDQALPENIIFTERGFREEPQYRIERFNPQRPRFPKPKR